MTNDNAPLGEPLSEADRARRLTEIRAHFKAANVDVPLDAPMKERTARVSAGIGLMSSGREYTEVLLAHIDALEGQLATAQERLNTAEGRGITAEQVAAVINPGAWRELESHASDLFKNSDERARYEASFAEAIRQTRAPSLAAAERVLAFFRPEPARALGLDGGGSDA